MDVVGSEIGQKMRSAIKAKLTELGCYVDDELPDYVMVMVANKRTRAQMEDDLQLFLGDNTELFVNWLHQVLKKLQEVTVTPKQIENDKTKERSQSKERKSKEKKSKDKSKKSDLKKAKKKEKEKVKLRKKEDKKTHKSKKKSKHHEMIRPNIPPLLMNIEKESEPSITDVFAGQILKNHGISLDMPMEDPKPEVKPVIPEVKRPILPIIDPATISTQPEPEPVDKPDQTSSEDNRSSVSSITAPKEDQMEEINKIEAKIQGLKQKLAEQLDSMSDDEDFLNIRTEAEELMNDFAEDVFQEISEQAPAHMSPPKQKSPTPPPVPIPEPAEIPKEISKDPEPQPEVLPQIELKLPKRPIRERLGAREGAKAPEPKEKETVLRTDSPERFTPEREPDVRTQAKSAKSRLGEPTDTQKRNSVAEEAASDLVDNNKRVTSNRSSVLESRPSRSTCASVVRVRPRPRVAAPSSSLLLRAVADAHKSLLNIPPKVEPESHKIKRALVLPMRRCVDAQKIVIQVPADTLQAETGDSISLGDVDSDDDKSFKLTSDADKDEYIPAPVSKQRSCSEYTPSRRSEGRTTTRKDDTLIIETINIHNPTVDKDKSTQFIVTMDGYHPNAFLAKKLLTEGLLNEQDDTGKTKKSQEKICDPDKDNIEVPKEKTLDNSSEIEAIKTPEKEPKLKEKRPEKSPEKANKKHSNESPKNANRKRSKTEDLEEPPRKRKTSEATEEIRQQLYTEKSQEVTQAKRLSNTSDESDTQVIIKKEEDKSAKRKSEKEDSPPVKKRRASPIVFDVDKKEKEVVRARERTESVGSDNLVTVTTVTNTHKYDTVPPLSAAERKLVWCRAFPLCRYGSACAFAHPRCKFAAACTRRNCVYSHSPLALSPPVTPTPPSIASHVVPVGNYKSITASAPSLCKFYPQCVNPACPFLHPKPCRYGAACGNRLHCNFHHADAPHKWRYPV